MYLRQNSATIFVAADTHILGTQKHFIEAAGHSEHAWFTNGFQTPGKLDPIATGPKTSMPRYSNPKPKGKTSEVLLKRDVRLHCLRHFGSSCQLVCFPTLTSINFLGHQ